MLIMEAYCYILAVLIAYFGLICGIITEYIAKEELKTGKRYFAFLQSAITALIIFLLLGFFRVHLVINIAFLIMFFAVIQQLKFPKSYLLYPVFVIIIYLARIRTNEFALIAALVFLYGFPTAALMSKFDKNEHWTSILANWRIVLHHATFILFSLLIFLI